MSKQTDKTAGKARTRRGRRRRTDRRVPVCLRRPQQSGAAVSVQFDLTLCPFDGAFEAFAEETLEDVEKTKIRRSATLKVTLSDLGSSWLEGFSELSLAKINVLTKHL